MIYINRLKLIDGNPKLVEVAQFDGENVTGDISIKGMSREEVLDEFNRGYYRTSED